MHGYGFREVGRRRRNKDHTARHAAEQRSASGVESATLRFAEETPVSHAVNPWVGPAEVVPADLAEVAPAGPAELVPADLAEVASVGWATDALRSAEDSLVGLDAPWRFAEEPQWRRQVRRLRRPRVAIVTAVVLALACGTYFFFGGLPGHGLAPNVSLPASRADIPKGRPSVPGANVASPGSQRRRGPSPVGRSGATSAGPSRSAGAVGSAGGAGSAGGEGSAQSSSACVISSDLGSCGPYEDTQITGTTGGTTINVANDVWDPVSGASQTLSVSSPGDWSVTASVPAGHATVMSYPSVSADYMQASSDATPLSDYASIYSSFTEDMNATSGTDAWAGYNVNVGTGSSTAYDVRIIHDVAGDGPCEGAATASFGGSGGVPVQSWSLCTYGSEIVWQLTGSGERSGTVDILAMLQWLVSNGHLPSGTGLLQVNYGWQIASTGGHSEIFQLTRYTLAVNSK